MTVKLPTTTAVILSEAKDLSIDFSPTVQNDGERQKLTVKIKIRRIKNGGLVL
ncbi:MAG: hypothetical protein IJ566_07465 [Cardiobacteriaceae bacterium]|nr:hypothetical protein [Cardiobacteriaceae bacterium]